MKIPLLFLSIFFCFTSYSQSLISISEIENEYKLGTDLFNDEKYDQAFTRFSNAFNLSKILDNPELIGRGYYNLSKHYLSQNEYIRAIDEINTAIGIFESLNLSLELSDCYFQLGAIHGKISNFEEALIFYFKALRLKEQLADDVGVALILNKIGNIYLYIPKLDKAEENYKRALGLNLKHNNHLGITFNSINIGVIYQNNKDYDKAIGQFKSVLEKIKEYKIPKIEQAVLYGNIGSTLTSQKKYNEALKSLFIALKLKEEVKNDGRTAHTCNDIAYTYIQMKQYNSAKEFAVKAINYSKNENLFQHTKAYQILSECDYQLGNYQSSYSNLKLYNKFQDSILSIQNLANINENQIKYETEKRELKIQAQESDIALLNEKSKVKNQYMFIGTLGLISLFGFVLLVRSRNKEKQKQMLQAQFSRDLLQSQENERERIAKDLHDSVGQQLTLIKRKSQNAAQDEISQLTNNALEDVRSISKGLYPAMLKQLGLTESIEQLVLVIDENTNIFYSSEIESVDDFFNEESGLNFYRFIQECLNNAIKHSKAKAISISIVKLNNQISITIKDNGVGFNINKMERKNSLGLKTLSERIQILNGKLKILSEINLGTTISATIPII
jgi:signal transduction histidine kinase/Tfp pilus assembly protein PilF